MPGSQVEQGTNSTMKIDQLGIVEYSEAFALQEKIADAVRQGRSPETLLLLEHYPVYTIGRGGCDENILDPSIQAVRISRGGDVTYHGPGQLVGYPVLDLKKRGGDLRLYLRFLEEVLIAAVAGFGVSAFRVPGKTGVWTPVGKLAAIGVGVRHWVSMHGFAMNVNNDLTGFTRINPCGIATCPIASLEKLCGSSIPMNDVMSKVSEQFEALLPEWLAEKVTA